VYLAEKPWKGLIENPKKKHRRQDLAPAGKESKIEQSRWKISGKKAMKK